MASTNSSFRDRAAAAPFRTLVVLWQVVCCLAVGNAAHADRFEFVALGDTAYNVPADYPLYSRLIDRINAIEPAFSIHVGDTWGAMPCSEESHRTVLSWFARFYQPVVYTPGDNEWTDCRKPEVLRTFGRVMAGQATPEERAELGRLRSLDSAFAAESYGDVLGSLAALRRVFFAEPRSLGTAPMPLLRQADESEFDEMVENSRWQHGGVVFTTVHVTGSGNGFTINDPLRANEAVQRNRANIAWLKAAFADATSNNAKAVVVALHASLFEAGPGEDNFGTEVRGGDEGPYFWVALAIRDLTDAFGKPVLLIQGDYHDFIVDQPFRVDQGEARPPRFANIWRLQVFGAPDIKAVRVSVDTESPTVFSFAPLHD